jgi:hypothetical protein
LDKQEATHREAEFLKERKISVSNILVPHPNPDIPSEIVSKTRQSVAIQNPLSMLTGNAINNNNNPSLEEEMTAVVTPKLAN